MTAKNQPIDIKTSFTYQKQATIKNAKSTDKLVPALFLNKNFIAPIFTTIDAVLRQSVMIPGWRNALLQGLLC